ncbi:hypothetical protein LZG74_19905 [Dyadobacter sp. CY327]|uniref:hypothetical protein n=1 Tax=Dyadobacter sp. CY327 TaxID=2907301 RepID=UPI001F165520|nr:hypothetical protein [Dyadobacter sp. CY327]MCE7072590.1 hypothetical protein [Dyadobacter sp. CY327]
MSVKIKIDSISSVQEASLAIQFGADALGIICPKIEVGHSAALELTARISAMVPPSVPTYMMTGETVFEDIARRYNFIKSAGIQLDKPVSSLTYRHLRQLLPGVKLLQVIEVNGQGCINECKKAVSEGADMILLRPAAWLPGQVLGRETDPDYLICLTKIVQQLLVPVYISVAYPPSSFLFTSELVKPFGLVVDQMVRTNGKLDTRKLKEVLLNRHRNKAFEGQGNTYI